MDAMRCARARPPGGVDARRPCVMRVRRSRARGGGGGRTRSGRVLTNGQVASGRVRTPPRSLASPASRRPVALCRGNDPSRRRRRRRARIGRARFFRAIDRSRPRACEEGSARVGHGVTMGRWMTMENTHNASHDSSVAHGPCAGSM